MIDATDWARDILIRAHAAARRFNPDATIRVARASGQVQAVLAEAPAPDDQALRLDDVTVYVEAGLEGRIDVEEPHDRLVLRPPGSAPNLRPRH
ncbi:MAG: hypothetical protein ACRDIZ_02670 [Actinomycetota bacterium]